MKAIFKVASITVANGADNIGTYIPLFSEARKSEIAVYVVTYYILVGVWCLVAFLIMKQRHVLHLAEKYARVVVPFLYLGLGMYIVIKSRAYPWSIERIDDGTITEPGAAVMAIITTLTLLSIVSAMIWVKLRKNRRAPPAFLETDRVELSVDRNAEQSYYPAGCVSEQFENRAYSQG